MKAIAICTTIALLTGCMNVPIPAGQEQQKSFTRSTDKKLTDVYRIITRQMTACYRMLGVFGNGIDVQDTIDTQNNRAVIETYIITLNGAEQDHTSMFWRQVELQGEPTGTRIISTASEPKYAYVLHEQVPVWLAGEAACQPQYVKRTEGKASDYDF